MTASPDLDAIAHLDFRAIGCQCPMHECHGDAAYVVAIHAVNACNQPGLDPFGNRVRILCGHCVGRLHMEVAERLDALAKWGIVFCIGCQAPLVEASDVIRSVGEL